MKKFFEILLMLILLYGVYALCKKIIPILVPEPKDFVVVIVSVLVSIILMAIYRLTLVSETKVHFTQKIQELEKRLAQKDELIFQKEQEIKEAQSFKQSVYDAAEKTIS
jgi:Ca2+/H+ antiporter